MKKNLYQKQHFLVSNRFFLLKDILLSARIKLYLQKLHIYFSPKSLSLVRVKSYVKVKCLKVNVMLN